MKIQSYTLKQLDDGNDLFFLHRGNKLVGLQEPELLYCYANTIVLQEKSAEYATNGIKYRIFILLEDFYTIAGDNDISLEEAVKFSIYQGDVHIRCTCPSFLYHGFAYQGTQLDYIYGLPKENRYPEITNPSLQSTTCKHCTMAIKWCLSHIDQIVKLFSSYYNKISEGSKLISVDQNGNEVQIGTKNGEGDVFMEEDWEEPFKKMENLEIEEDEDISDDDSFEEDESYDEEIDEEVESEEEAKE